MRKPLAQVAERHGLAFPISFYNLSPLWLPRLVQAEYNLDEQQVKLYVEAKEKVTISEILAYLMAVGIGNVYKGPSYALQRMIFDKANVSLFSILEYDQNQRTWFCSLRHAIDPTFPLQLKAQFKLNVEAILVWIYSTWVNVSGIMHPLDENPMANRGATELPDFLLPSQVANLMLVQTEDLIPLIAPTVWPIFGAVMTLMYPTQS